MTLENFNIGQSSNYIPNYALPLSDTTVANLRVNTDTIITVPKDAANVLISATDNVFVGSGRITLPAAGSTAIQSIRLNPEVMSLKDLTQLHILALSACYITLTWFRNVNESLQKIYPLVYQ